MAKRVTAPRPGTKQPEWITDDHRHRDLNGNPICLRCPHYQYYIVRGRRACFKWEKGAKQ